MKTLADGTNVPGRMYYYLLDWNDRNGCGAHMRHVFCKERLNDLNKAEFTRLFAYAVATDIAELGGK